MCIDSHKRTSSLGPLLGVSACAGSVVLPSVGKARPGTAPLALLAATHALTRTPLRPVLAHGTQCLFNVIGWLGSWVGIGWAHGGVGIRIACADLSMRQPQDAPRAEY